jgi:hypothetical protein
MACRGPGGNHTRGSLFAGENPGECCERAITGRSVVESGVKLPRRKQVGLLTDEEALRRLLIQNELDELRGYLLTPGETPLAKGSGVPLVSGGAAAQTSSGLVVPATAVPAPIDYVGVYVTLDEYAPDPLLVEGVTSRDVAEMITTRYYPRDQLVLALALLNRMAGASSARLGKLSEYYAGWLSDDSAARLRGILSAEGGRRRVLLARQPILAAARAAIVHGHDNEPNPQPEKPLDVHAILLSHAVASQLHSNPDDDRVLAGFPARLVMEILRVGLLYQSDDPFASIDRFSRLWLEYGENLERVRLRGSPRDLLRESTGLEIEDVLAMGFALLAHTMNWSPDEEHHPYLSPQFGSIGDDRIARFVELVSDDLDGFRRRFREHEGDFDFLPFQQTPVVRAEPGLLAIDQAYLWDRVTSGLYWDVHDFEKEHHGDEARTRWTQAYAEMLERMAEDQIEAMAPPILGGKSFYTEEDFREAFSGKQADAGIDFGATFVLFEIVSAQLAVPTRIEGDLEQFEKDTDRLVIKKCRQLSDVAHALLADDSCLTGFARSKKLRVHPVVVVGGGYPIHPFTVDYIDGILRDEGLLLDARIRRLAIVDIGELEILEALVGEGHSIVDVLDGWKSSSLHAAPLKNYVIREFGGERSFRPERMRDRVDQTFRTIIERLGFSDEQDADD